MTPESFSENSPSLLETRGDVPITLEYNGITYTLTLKEWFGFCPEPHDQMDPARVEEVARDFLEGRNPFVQKDTPEI